jgi:beta-mannosidase
LDVTLVSDDLTTFTATLQVNIYQFTGDILWSHKQSVIVPANASEEIFSLELANIISLEHQDNSVIVASLVDVKSAQTLAQNTHFLVANKALALQPANIACTKIIANEQLIVTFDTDTFVRQMYVNVSGHDGNFSDNFFDLIPLLPKTIRLSLPGMSHKDITALADRLSWRSLIDSFDHQYAQTPHRVGIK